MARPQRGASQRGASQQGGPQRGAPQGADRAAQLWCENASRLTGTEWLYIIVHQKEFEKLHPDEFADLVALQPISLL